MFRRVYLDKWGHSCVTELTIVYNQIKKKFVIFSDIEFLYHWLMRFRAASQSGTPAFPSNAVSPFTMNIFFKQEPYQRMTRHLRLQYETLSKHRPTASLSYSSSFFHSTNWNVTIFGIRRSYIIISFTHHRDTATGWWPKWSYIMVKSASFLLNAAVSLPLSYQPPKVTLTAATDYFLQ